ncbi:uncharacterized protein LOC134533748 isoform X3 [Bacillus rossius redtenbacheri]|uniref:uncharacterized protein LOC134533748 isoform X3 n=1 Tax=Bacillus rossius redtenbacheri TaxID=93214 RepID=UPI002FDE4BD1
MDETADIREQLFHNSVREYVIFLLFGLLLIILSSALIGRLRRRDKDDYDEDDAAVCKISVWLCTFSLAVSFGQVLLLPISIVSNEVLLNYPDSYYVKWLNSSLIQGFWNHMFLLSNLSLFVLLPFAFLFQESVGFSGFRRSLIARVIETSIVFTLMSFLVLGMTYILSSFLDEDRSSIQTLLSVWSYYLPFQYSCVSFLGVLMLVSAVPPRRGRGVCGGPAGGGLPAATPAPGERDARHVPAASAHVPSRGRLRGGRLTPGAAERGAAVGAGRGPPPGRGPLPAPGSAATYIFPSEEFSLSCCDGAANTLNIFDCDDGSAEHNCYCSGLWKQGFAIQYNAVQAGRQLVVHVGRVRLDPGDSPDLLPASDVVRRPVHVAGVLAGAAEASRHLAHPRHRQLRAGAGAELRPAAALQDTGHHKL